MLRIWTPYVFLFVSLVWSSSALGQAFGPRLDPSVPVRDSSGVKLPFPWTGGLNFCQFSRLDVDRDGQRDLFVFDRSGDKVEIFLRRGNGWEHTDTLDHRFPALTDWVLCRDFDNDGNKDLFTGTSGGIAVHRNEGGNELSFHRYTGQLLSDHYPNDTSTDPINIYVQEMDIPAIDDIDGDGDLDILSFHIFGTQVEYHKNVALERTGKTDTMIFERKNACWGFFSEGGIGGAINLNDSCSGNVQNPEWSSGGKKESGERHSGSTLLTLDMNGNGAKDLVLGDLGSEEMWLLENGGGPSSSHMVDVLFPFPSNTTSVDIPIFPAAYHLDVDHDGIRDLLVSPNKGNNSANRESILFYRNKGSDSIPDFEFIKRDFLQDSTIDVGEGAFPAFCDIDEDGDQDLFLGNQKLHTKNGDQGSSIAFMENIGSSSSPSFRLRTHDYKDLSKKGMGKGLHPAFGDISGSLTPDIIIGDSDGYVHYLENSSDVGEPASFTLVAPEMEDHQGKRIDVGQYAAPTLVDLNRDGLLDLVIGEKDGNLNYYENVGTTSSPSFMHRTDSLGEVMVTSSAGYEGYSVPRFLEDSGSYELVVGSKSGRLHYYKGIDSIINNGPFQKLTSFFGGIEGGKRSSPAIAEMTGDEHLDMIVGGYGGGVRFYKGKKETQTSLSANSKENSLTRIHPNPVRSGEKLTLRGEPEAKLYRTEVRLLDVRGHRIELPRIRRGSRRVEIQLPELDRGIYFLRTIPNGEVHKVLVR